MKITAFSDTHGLHRQTELPESDIFIFAGDCMTCGYREYELVDFLNWYEEQPAKHKVMIAGNHDRIIENHRDTFEWHLKKHTSITYLEDSGVCINGLDIWGTPHSKKFCNWAFNRREEQMEERFSLIPDHIDILVSHAPQYGILDQLENGMSVGEKTLSERIKSIPSLRYHIFGHIHCAYGKQNGENYNSINASVVNEQYQLTNKPVTFKTFPHG